MLSSCFVVDVVVYDNDISIYYAVVAVAINYFFDVVAVVVFVNCCYIKVLTVFKLLVVLCQNHVLLTVLSKSWRC